MVVSNVLRQYGVHFICLYAILFGSFYLVKSSLMAPSLPPQPQPIINIEISNGISSGPFQITTQVPDGFLDYNQVTELMKQWNREALQITEFGIYGHNRQGTELRYLRIGTPGKPKILVHAAIHGNERLATACTLGVMGKMLHDYKRSDEVTWLIENRDVYFVPVFSPESYLRSRHIEEGDPNRNWAYPGGNTNNISSPILAIQQWFHKMRFVGVIDGHTFGEDFFYPSIAKANDKIEFHKLASEMSELARYSPDAVGEHPRGYAIDWYYWKGAVAILIELGDGNPGNHAMPVSKILPETNRTYSAYLHFIRRSPEIRLSGVNDASSQRKRIDSPPINDQLNNRPARPPSFNVTPPQRKFIRLARKTRLDANE